MLNREKHQLIMGKILKDIYEDVSISSLIGLKGGTCAYLFYGLPRFSVDLDFDLLSAEKKEQISEKIGKILKNYGEVKNNLVKHNTIFSILSYGEEDHNIKIGINTRPSGLNIRGFYEIKEYLGISVSAGKPDYLFAGKLSALTLRKETAMRDIYDVWYFSKNNWDINRDFIKERTGKSIKEQLSECISVIEKVKDSEVLRGLGELLDEKEKNWVRNNLKSEVLFALKNYLSVLK